jgi:hypothetical protein
VRSAAGNGEGRNRTGDTTIFRDEASAASFGRLARPDIRPATAVRSFLDRVQGIASGREQTVRAVAVAGADASDALTGLTDRRGDQGAGRLGD